METDKNPNITEYPSSRPNNGTGPGKGNRKKGLQKTKNTTVTAQDTSDDIDRERHPIGERSSPVTNEDEQRKATNAEIDGVMGEKETEGV